MSKSYNCTILIPTHNRHGYLKRCINYLSNFHYPVLICDSSNEAFEILLPDHIRYIHFPGLKFVDKIIAAIAMVETDYIMLCADDDFVIKESLAIAVSKIQDRKDILCVVGNHLAFDSEKNEGLYVFKKIYPELILTDNIQSNIKVFFKNYQQILWALYEKEHLLNCFKIIEEAKIQNDNFIEIILGAATLCAGKIVSIKEFTVAREITQQDHWGKQHESLVSIKNNTKTQQDFDRVCSVFEAHFPKGRRNVELTIDSYLSGIKRSAYAHKIKSFLRFIKIIKFIKLIFLKQPDNHKQKQNKVYCNDLDVKLITDCLRAEHKQ